ncbi:MAG: PQQ-binding-like beta-propeller repeat protein [Victivallales bacterium]|nr:PQQ-binding-like beta-propeller repeat protein [Victivallales bacterium]
MPKSIRYHSIFILCLLLTQTIIAEPFGFSADKRNWETVTEPYPLPQATTLYQDGKPVFDIITTNTPGGKVAAEAIAKECLKYGDAPSIIIGSAKDRVPSRTAIMLGNIIDNPAMMTLYARNAIIADKLFPGPGGFVIRTIFEPFHRGADVIALEASDDDGLKNAAADFIKYLDKQPLPPIFQANYTNISKVSKPSEDHLAKGLELAKTRLATGFHTSLGGQLADIAKRYLVWQEPQEAKLYVAVAKLFNESAVGDPRKFGGPWGFDSDFPSYFAITGWDLIEHDSSLTPHERLETCQTLMKWLNEAIAREALAGRKSQAVVSNHLTFASQGMLAGALYFQKTYPNLKTPHDWLAVAKSNFHRQVTAGKVMDDCDSYQWLTWRHCLTYTLALPDDTFIDNGMCALGVRVCGLTMDNMAAQAPYGDDSGWASSGSEMPFLRMAYAATRLPLAGTLLAMKSELRSKPVIGDYVCPPVFTETNELSGLQILPLDAKYHASVKSESRLPLEKIFDKLSYRKSLTQNGLYVLIDGVNNGGHRHEDANSILRLSFLNRNWLMENDYTKPQQKYHNSLLMLVNGEAFSLPDYVELLSSGSNDDISWAFIRANDVGPANWTRYVFWLHDEEAMVVIDKVEAKSAAHFQLKQRWNGIGECQPRNDGIQLSQKGPFLRLQCWQGASFTTSEDSELGRGWARYPYAPPVAHVLDQTFSENIPARGHTMLGTVIHGVASGDVPPWSFVRTDNGFELDTGVKKHVVAFTDNSLVDFTSPSNNHLPEPPPSPVIKAAKFTGRSLDATIICTGKSPFTKVLPIQDLLFATTKTGDVFGFDETGKIVHSFSVNAQINDIAAADLDKDGQLELLLACQDYTLKAVKQDGTPVWTYTFGYYRTKPFCNVVRIADLEGDGNPTILVACENWRVYALDFNGKERWNFEVVRPACAVETADMDGDGKLEILCGTRYYYATVLSHEGRKIWGGKFARGCQGIAAPLSGGKQRTLVIGGDEGKIDFYRPVGKEIKTFATGDQLRMATFIRRQNTDEKEDVIIGSDNGFAYRFDCNGKLIWSRNLSSSVHVVRADGMNSIFGTTAGHVVVIDENGSITATYRCNGAISDIRPLDGGRLAVVTAAGELIILK